MLLASVHVPFFTHVQMLYDFHDKRVVTQVVYLVHRVADQVGYFIEEAENFSKIYLEFKEICITRLNFCYTLL